MAKVYTVPEWLTFYDRASRGYPVYLHGVLVSHQQSYFEAEIARNTALLLIDDEGATPVELLHDFIFDLQLRRELSLSRLADDLRDAQHAALVAGFRNAVTAAAIFDRLDDADDLEFELRVQEAA